jgi:type I restriction enzyme S subunit
VAITIAANIANSAVLTYPACFPDSVVGFVAEPDLCLPSYVEFFVRTVRERLAEFAPATAQKNINLETLGEVVVPLPPLAEQAEIVGRVDALFALATAIEQRVERAAARADNLPQAILSKAFAGELVPTEADLARQEGRDYESAEKLIERVRRSPSTPTSDAARSSRPRRRAGR